MTHGYERAANKAKGAAHRVYNRRLCSGGSQGCNSLSREGRHAV